MSHELDLAITLPNQTLLFGAAGAVGIVVLLLLVAVIRKSRAKKRVITSWSIAAQELDLELVSGGSDLGPTAQGKVNDHVITVAPLPRKGRKRAASTLYSVRFEATQAPKFRLNKRMDTDRPTVDTGNPKFDAVVAIYTDHPVLLSRYLTASRRAAILRLLTHWPSAEVTNREAHLLTSGIELDHEKFVDSVCHLVAAAETFDRPEQQPATAPVAETTAVTDVIEEQTNLDADMQSEALGAPQTSTIEHKTNGDSDVLTEVRLDEVTVLGDLFNADLTHAQISARFVQVYQGREVTWAGEVVRVGGIDDPNVQRIAALIGSADGQNPESGRVVAITGITPDPTLHQGDVVTFTGTLASLDAQRRLFHLV